MKRILIALLLILGTAGAAMTAVSAAAPVTAHAAAPGMCDGGGIGAACADRVGCGGAGTSVIIWYNDSDSCESGAWNYVNICNSHPADQVTPTCPFRQGSGLNTKYLGYPTIEMRFADGNCVATRADASGITGSCGNLSTGAGAANGAIDVWGPGNDLVNRYWSDQHGTSDMICAIGPAGQLLYMDYANMGGSQCSWNY